jgi:sugar phosphate permease
MVSSTILIQHLTPNNMRGRVMSLFQLNMAFAQLMTMPVAILAQVFSLQTLFPVLAWITLIMVILVLVLKRQVVRVAIPRP